MQIHYAKFSFFSITALNCHDSHLTIIWLSPKIVFALTPPAPADPVLPNFDHVRICSSGWPGGHSFGFYFSISAKKNDKSLVKRSASLSQAILPLPVCGAICCKTFEARFDISYPGSKFSKPASIYSAPGWNFRSRLRNLLPASECCTRAWNIRTLGRIFHIPVRIFRTPVRKVWNTRHCIGRQRLPRVLANDRFSRL